MGRFRYILRDAQSGEEIELDTELFTFRFEDVPAWAISIRPDRSSDPITNRDWVELLADAQALWTGRGAG